MSFDELLTNIEHDILNAGLADGFKWSSEEKMMYAIAKSDILMIIYRYKKLLGDLAKDTNNN